MVKHFFNTATWKQSQITVLGTIINGGLGALFYIFLARFLGPSQFGLFVLSVATMTLIGDSVDFGTNTGLVRFVSANLNANRDKALKFLKLSLEFKLAVWFFVLILGLLLSPFIAQFIFKKEELTIPLRLVMLGVGGALLLSYATSALQAFQRYITWSLINISTNFLRIVIIFSLFYFGQLNLLNGLSSYIILPFFGFSLASLFLPLKQIFKVKEERSVAKEFFNFNVWVGIFTIIAAVSARLDTFLTARLLSSHELGIYGAASQLVQIVPQLITALGVVAAPKFASFTNNKDMISYLKKFQLLVLGIAILGLMTIPASYFVIPAIFGIEYLSAIGPFIILLIAMLIFLMSVPIHNSIIFYFGKPNFFVWVSIGHLLIISSLGYVLITNFGVIGAAVTVLVGTIFNLLLPLTWFLIKIRQ